MNNQPKEGLNIKNKKIFFGNSFIKAKSDENIIRYLGVWLNSGMKTHVMIQKAKEFVKQTIRILK